MSNSDYKLLYKLLVEQIKDNARAYAKPQYRDYPAGQAMRDLLSFKDGCEVGIGE